MYLFFLEVRAFSVANLGNAGLHEGDSVCGNLTGT